MARVSVLTNGGEAWAAGRLAGTIPDNGRYIGWGTGFGVAAKPDTTLFVPASESRVAGTVTVEGTGVAAKYTVTGTLTANADKTITNAANFTASSSGTLIVHSSFDPIDLSDGDQITFTFSIDPS